MLLGIRIELDQLHIRFKFERGSFIGGVGLWPDDEAVRSRLRRGAVYEPLKDSDWVAERRAEWRAAVARALL